MSASYQGHYINLKDSVNRDEFMQQQFADMQVQAYYSRFEAIAIGEKPTVIPVGTFAPREKGCLASHIRLLEQNTHSDKHLHILEDDVILCQHHHLLLERILSHMPNEWDIIYTGYTLIEFEASRYEVLTKIYKQLHEGEKHSLSVIALDNIDILGAFSYVINRASINKVYEIVKESNHPIDFLYQKASKDNLIKSFAIAPSIAKHAPKFPSTVRKEHNPKAYYVQCLYQELFYITANMEHIRSLFLAHLAKFNIRTDEVEPTFISLSQAMFKVLYSSKRRQIVQKNIQSL